MNDLLCKTHIVFFAGLLAAGLMNASELYVGPDTAGPVSLYSTGGVAMGTYGPMGATAAASDGLGDTFVSVPDFNNNSTLIYEYGSNPGAPLAQYTFQGSDPNVFDGYLDDLAYAGGSLWAAGYNGIIYNINFGTSMVVSSFNTGALSIGVATDGVVLYTTTGLGSGTINTYDMSGNLVSSFVTGLPDTLGIGYDSSDKTLWVGGEGIIGQVDMGGTILNTLAATTASGDPIVVSGLEIVNSPAVAPVPEPSAMALCGFGLLCLAVARRRKNPVPRRAPWGAGANTFGLAFVLVLAHPAFSTPNITSLTPSLVAPQTVGTTITWTASASDAGHPLWYRFSVSPPGGTYSIFRDYQSVGSFTWTPSQLDGMYHIKVTVKNQTDQTVSSFEAGYLVSSRVTTMPAVNGTRNPLVALYSSPPCPSGSSMRVRFWTSTDMVYHYTPTRACTPTSSMNFYIAGMMPHTTYSIQQDVIRGPIITPGPLRSFTTGTPTVTVSPSILVPSQPPTNQTQSVLLFTGLNDINAAIDMSGHLLWYYAADAAGIRRPEPGGNLLLALQPHQMASLTPEQNGEREILREIDVAGNTILETNAARVSELLGYRVNVLHHEVRRLPNGDLVFLGAVERMADQGSGTVDVIGDVIVVLDSNLNLVWSWNTFDHLDVHRPSTTNDVCQPSGPGCPPVYLASQANDWTHGNSVNVSADGKIMLYSARHQDWVFAIDYNNGTGSGNILWKLGYQGDFTLTNGNPSDWFSHQHEVEFELGGDTMISLFDNGNHRQQPASTSNSRGQVYQLDIAARTAALQLNADLGAYSYALGSAQRLSNGNYQFDLGVLPSAQFVEVNPSGAVVSRIQVANQQSYRCFRMRDMYTP